MYKRQGKWHHLLVSYDENASDDYELTVYLDGLLTGYTSDLGGKLQVKPSDDWLLGAATKQDPVNGRFIGLIDDLRFYRSLRAEELARETYNKGLGDLSLSIETDFPANTHDNPITANLLFKKYGEEYELSDFNSSRISLTNGDLVGFSGSGANWTIEFLSLIHI